MSNIIIDKIAFPLISMVEGYFNLKKYMEVKYKRLRGDFLEYNSEKLFWKDAIGEYFYQPSIKKLFPDNLVRLVDFEITEWFPRCPGLFWTEEGKKSRESARGDLLKLNNYVTIQPYKLWLLITKVDFVAFMKHSWLMSSDIDFMNTKILQKWKVMAYDNVL